MDQTQPQIVYIPQPKSDGVKLDLKIVAAIIIPIVMFFIGMFTNAFSIAKNIATVPYVDQQFAEGRKYTDQKHNEAMSYTNEKFERTQALLEDIKTSVKTIESRMWDQQQRPSVIPVSPMDRRQ